MAYLITVVILNLLFWTTLFSTIFLGRELLKKLRILERFLDRQGKTRRLLFNWKGYDRRMMRNIVIRSNQQFEVLIGFWLFIPILNVCTIDWYGSAKSKCRGGDHWEVTIGTYMGKKPVQFHFEMKTRDQASPWETTIELTDQEPMVVFPPHWWQRLGFFA